MYKHTVTITSATAPLSLNPFKMSEHRWSTEAEVLVKKALVRLYLLQPRLPKLPGLSEQISWATTYAIWAARNTILSNMIITKC